MKTALEIKNLTVKYPGYTHPAIENVSFSVSENSITALVGPNGSGKSTLLKALLGLVPHSGEVKVFGQPVEDVYHDIGYIPQRFSFDPTFPITVKEFIKLVLYNHSEKIAQKQLNKVLDYVEADNLAKRKLSTLSGGQLQRVLLARALAHNPKLLLLDEPEAGVDVGGEQTFYDLLEKLVKDKKATALVASHELDVVYAYAQNVICLNRKMFCKGKPKEVLTQEIFTKLYGRGLKFYGHSHIKNYKNHNH